MAHYTIRYNKLTNRRIGEVMLANNVHGEPFSDLPHKTLLRPDEVALFLSVSLKTVYRWYRTGLIEGTKVKRSLRIYRDSILRLVDGREATAGH
jgi:excisionase family DNA binding protein